MGLGELGGEYTHQRVQSVRDKDERRNRFGDRDKDDRRNRINKLTET